MELNLKELVHQMRIEHFVNGRPPEHTGLEDCLVCFLNDLKVQVSQSKGLRDITEKSVNHWLQGDGGNGMHSLLVMMFMLGKRFGEENTIQEIEEIIDELWMESESDFPDDPLSAEFAGFATAGY